MANGDGILAKLNGNSLGSKIETPNVKKRHRRAKSGGLKNVGDGDGKRASYVDCVDPIRQSDMSLAS